MLDLRVQALDLVFRHRLDLPFLYPREPFKKVPDRGSRHEIVEQCMPGTLVLVKTQARGVCRVGFPLRRTCSNPL